MVTAITGVAVWDGRSEAASPPGWTLRLEGDRIEALGSAPSFKASSRESRVIALDGATAIPGLIDGHVHLTLNPAVLRPADQLAVPAERLREHMELRAAAMAAAGITTARDLGGGAWHELALRDRIAAGEIPGPRLLCAGQPLTTPGGHCHFWGGEVADAGAIDSVIERQVAHDADWIKVMATGGLMTAGTRADAPQFEQAELRRAVATAAAHGRSVAAHCHGREGIARAARAGVRTIEHCSFAGKAGFGADFDPALVEELATREALWVSPTVNANWAARARRHGAPSAFGLRMVRVLRALRDAGVRFVASTDAGIPGVAHHRLPEALAAFAWLAGLRPVEALRTATSDAAAALGLADESGALEPGLCADILVVDGDPLRDLSALLRPKLVVARGRIVYRAEGV